MADFQSRIAEKGYLVRGITPADGNCFFHAMVDQLPVVNQINDVSTLRADLLKYIRNLPEDRKLEIGNFMQQSLEQYLDALQCDGTYADHVCIQQFSNMTGLAIRIVQAQSEDVLITPDVQSSTPAILSIGYLPNLQHYVSLGPKVQFATDDFVAVSIGQNRHKKIFLAKILEVDDDVKVRFLKACPVKGVYTWPPRDDVSWQPRTDIIKKLTTPELLPGRGIKLKFLEHELNC